MTRRSIVTLAVAFLATGVVLMAVVVGTRIRAAHQRKGTNVWRTLCTLRVAVQAFEVSNTRLPDSLDELTVTRGYNPPLLDKAVLVDPWGHPFRYRKTSKFNFEIGSDGPDGRSGTKDDITWN